MRNSLIFGIILLASPAVVPGGENLLYNSSFELGTYGWNGNAVVYKYPGIKNPPPVREIDTSTAVHGRQSLKITTGDFYHDMWMVTSPDVELVAGKTYTVSFHAKANKPFTLRTSMHCNHMEHWDSASGMAFHGTL